MNMASMMEKWYLDSPSHFHLQLKFYPLVSYQVNNPPSRSDFGYSPLRALHTSTPVSLSVSSLSALLVGAEVLATVVLPPSPCGADQASSFPQAIM